MNKKAIIFSGQGAQFPGMSKGLNEEVFRLAEKVLNRDILDICENGLTADLNLTHNTQPCVLATDLSAFKTIDVKPDAVAGFSLGEYAALVAAKVLDIKDAFRIIQIRADAMQSAVPVGKGAMAAVMKIPEEEILKFCDMVNGYVAPANYNSPDQIVVSGEKDAVKELMRVLKEAKIRSIELPVSAPFHCRLMDPAKKVLESEFEKIGFGDATIPIYMNVDGKAETNGKIIKEKLLLQTVSPVRWVDTIENMNASGITDYIECGPGKTLTGFVKKIIPDANAKTYNELMEK